MPNSLYTSINSDYLQANPTWHAEASEWKATQILKLLQRNNLQPKLIAEIGCGAGEILNQLHFKLIDKSVHFFGYEIAPDAIALCKKREKERLSFYQEDLTISDNYFDLLLLIDVVEHIDDYLGFINKSKTKAEYKVYHFPLDMSVLSILVNYP